MENYLNISIVLFNSEYTPIAHLVNELRISEKINHIFLVDNSPSINKIFETCNATYIFNGKNLGFGAGHNIAIKQSIEEGTNYHLVLNSDIYVESNTINRLMEYIVENRDVGLIMPKIKNEDGSVQLLPKLLPSPIDLLIKVFPLFKKFAEKRSRLYVLADYQNRELNIPIISGCFGIFNTDVFKEVGFYDEKFFMYFEDFDLSRRIHKKYKTIYFPDVSIIHQHERGAKKSLKLFFTFISSAITYFNKHGWFFDKERKRINNEVLKKLK